MLSEADLALRQQGVGGSEVAAVLGLDPYCSPIEIWARKVGEPVAEPNAEAQARMRWGQVLEPVVADEYVRRHPEIRRIGSLPTQAHATRPWHIYSVDRLVDYGPPGAPELAVLECKARGWQALRSYEERGALSDRDHCQVAWYLAGLEVERGCVATLYNSHDYREHELVRDLELEAYLLEEVERFWRERVLAHVPPEPDGSPAFGRYLRERWQRTSGVILPASPIVDSLATELRTRRAQLRKLERAVELAEQDLETIIGDADGVETAHGRVTWRRNRESTRTDWQTVVDRIRTWDDISPAIHAGIDRLIDDNSSTKPGARVLRVPRSWTATDGDDND